MNGFQADKVFNPVKFDISSWKCNVTGAACNIMGVFGGEMLVGYGDCVRMCLPTPNKPNIKPLLFYR